MKKQDLEIITVSVKNLNFELLRRDNLDMKRKNQLWDIDYTIITPS